MNWRERNIKLGHINKEINILESMKKEVKERYVRDRDKQYFKNLHIEL